MRWYGRAGEWYGAGCGYGKVRPGKEGHGLACRCRWVVGVCLSVWVWVVSSVWSGLSLSWAVAGCCWSSKRGRRATDRRQELGGAGWWELGAGGGQSRGGGEEGRQNSKMWRAAHTRTHTPKRD